MSGTNNVCEVSPFMNTDIGGLGVRISFYLQTIFLAALSARSEKLDEITGALSTLIVTNMAMAVTALILGLKHGPEMSFQDGLVVFYLLAISWVTVFFSLPSFHRFPAGTKALKLLSILQSYLIFTFAFVILIKAEKFGNHPDCNPIAVVVLFRPFSALKVGKIIGWIAVGTVTAVYTGITVLDFLPPSTIVVEQWMARQRTRKDQEPVTPQKYEPKSFETPQEASISRRALQQPDIPQNYVPNVSGELVVKLIVICISWTIAVVNTELLIKWNHLKQDPSAQSPWQFGQVLPMFLLVQPFLNLVSAFTKYKLRRRAAEGRSELANMNNTESVVIQSVAYTPSTNR